MFFYSGSVEKSLCTLERIEAVISDCKGSTINVNVEDYSTDKHVDEAAIITWRVAVSTFQSMG